MLTRALTQAERAGLSAGLVRALDDAGAEPQVSGRAHPAAVVSSLWRGHVPILTLGRTIHWPQALADFSAAPQHMAILQHELHHVLEYATGVLTPVRYLINPRNWTYDLTLSESSRWSSFGAEQRAMLAELLWQAEHGVHADAKLDQLR